MLVEEMCLMGRCVTDHSCVMESCHTGGLCVIGRKARWNDTRHYVASKLSLLIRTQCHVSDAKTCVICHVVVLSLVEQPAGLVLDMFVSG